METTPDSTRPSWHSTLYTLCQEPPNSTARWLSRRFSTGHHLRVPGRICGIEEYDLFASSWRPWWLLVERPSEPSRSIGPSRHQHEVSGTRCPSRRCSFRRSTLCRNVLTIPRAGFCGGVPRWAAANFAMPAMSPTMTEGNISSWKVKEGMRLGAHPALFSRDR